jgi:hypothetical protein
MDGVQAPVERVDEREGGGAVRVVSADAGGSALLGLHS